MLIPWVLIPWLQVLPGAAISNSIVLGNQDGTMSGSVTIRTVMCLSLRDLLITS